MLQWKRSSVYTIREENLMVSAYVQDHFANPRNIGTLVNADAMGLSGIAGQGPFMQMFVRMEFGKIVEARFDTYGCPVARGCGSWLSCWVVGKTPEQALVIEAEDLMRILGGLPLGKEHCAALAVDSLRDALSRLGADEAEYR